MKKTIFLAFVMMLALATSAYAGGLPEDSSSLTAGAPSAEASGASGALSSMDVYPGQNAVLKLKADKEAGYTWEIAEPWDENVIELVGKESLSAPGQGALGAEVWTFKAANTGSVNISFRYVDPTGASAPGSENAVFTINVIEGAAVKSGPNLQQPGPLTVSGTLESVVLSGAATRVNPVIALKQDSGETVEFVVKPLCYVYGSAGQMSASDLKEGARVNVNYRVNKKGVNEAVAIRVE